MSDGLENLQIKRELSSPSTLEDKSYNIKAKLNLHVKRRLQDINQSGQQNTLCKETATQIANKQDAQKTETFRQKRPYHKKTDKIKCTAQSSDNTSIVVTSNETSTPQRTKYKHKIKQIVANDNQDILASNSTDEVAVVHNNALPIVAGAISAGDEDDGGHDNELKASREKEKCPDVLAMVLSMKKRALMEDPEVQSFLKEVMNVIKS